MRKKNLMVEIVDIKLFYFITIQGLLIHEFGFYIFDREQLTKPTLQLFEESKVKTVT